MNALLKQLKRRHYQKEYQKEYRDREGYREYHREYMRKRREAEALKKIQEQREQPVKPLFVQKSLRQITRIIKKD